MLFTRAVRMSVRRSAPIVSPTIFAGSISKSSSGRLDAADDGDVRGLVPEIAEEDGQRRLRRAGHADEHHVRLVEPPPHAVVVLHRELDRLDPLEVGRVERRTGSRLHARGHPRDARDGVDRVAEQVAVVDACATTELSHRVPELGRDERVHHHRRPSSSLLHGDMEVVDVLDAGVPDLLERLIRELGLEREHEALRRLTGRVRDDVELDRHAVAVVAAHGRRLAPDVVL